MKEGEPMVVPFSLLPRASLSDAWITLRDYFAVHGPEPDAQTIANAKSYDRSRNPNNDPDKPRPRDEYEIRAQLRYKYADAMLRERGK